MGDVQECEEVWQEWHRALCAKCVELGTRAMFRSVRKFGMSGTGLCVHSVYSWR